MKNENETDLLGVIFLIGLLAILVGDVVIIYAAYSYPAFFGKVIAVELFAYFALLVVSPFLGSR